MKLTLFQAEAVWLTLVNYCGADPDQQEDFVRLAQETDGLEYRFQGTLGFGGKVRVENPLRVSCYREDETPARRKVIEHANAFLIALARLWVEPGSN